MRKKIQNWEEVFEQQRQSGKSIEQFCKDIGIHYNTYYKNRKKFADCANPTIVEIKPAPPSAAAPIVIKTKKFMISISNGFDEGQLKSVLKVIGELE